MGEAEEKKPEGQGNGWSEKFSSRTADFMSSGKGRLDKFLKKAKDEIVGTGDISRSQAEKLTAFFRRDFSAHAENLRKTGENLKKNVAPKRLSATLRSTFARSLKNVAGKLEEVAEKSEKTLEYKTGEIAGPGTLCCKECGGEMKLASAVRIPPCPKCHKTVFRITF